MLPFIKEHIALDLQALQKILGKSNDDVCVFVHCILKSIMDQQVPNNTGNFICKYVVCINFDNFMVIVFIGFTDIGDYIQTSVT